MNYGNLKRLWNRLGFRRRLTLCLSAIFAMILAVGYWSLFVEFQNQLQIEFDNSLFNYGADLLQNVKLDSGGEADLPFEVIFSADKIFPFPHGDALVKIYRKPFVELFSFSSDKDAPKNLNELKQLMLRNEDNQFLDLKSESGEVWRGLLMQIDDIPVPEIYFFVAVPRESLTNQENKFRSIFIAGQLFIFALSAFMISVLAKSLLGGLDRLTKSIQQMPINLLSQPSFRFYTPEGPPEIRILTKVLNRLLTRTHQSLEAHQEFVAQAAHQLKTPLTIARGNLEQWEKSLPPESVNSHLQTALGEIDNMSGTITNLLNLVQIESGFQTVKKTNIDFLEQILLEIDRLEYLARKKNLKFQIQCQDIESGLLNWSIKTDPQLLSIIVYNALENAIKYATESPIEVKLGNSDQHLTLRVNNYFVGQAEKTSPELLKEKFYRGQTPEPGQGLGLYIAYKIAAILEMNLMIKNEPPLFNLTLEIPKES